MNERRQAEMEYKAAFKVWKRIADASNDEAAFLAADAALDAARSRMCKLQAQYPTRAERYAAWRDAAFAWQN